MPIINYTDRKEDRDRRLPSREVAYAYTAAMHFAQQFEINLRAFLHTADYHAWIDFELTEDQKKRYKDFEGFLDKATCGLLLEKLRKSGAKLRPDAVTIFDRACGSRNRLAHCFLAEYDFDTMTLGKQRDLIKELNRMTVNLYKALVISRAIRSHVEKRSDLDMAPLKELMAELGMPDYEDAGRKYDTRRKPKAKK